MTLQNIGSAEDEQFKRRLKRQEGTSQNKEGRNTGPEDLDPQLPLRSDKGQSSWLTRAALLSPKCKLPQPARLIISIHHDSELLADRGSEGPSFSPALSICCMSSAALGIAWPRAVEIRCWASSDETDRRANPLPLSRAPHLHPSPLGCLTPSTAAQISRLRKPGFPLTAASLSLPEPKQIPIDSH